MIIQCQLSINEYVQRWYAELARVAILSKYRPMDVLPFFNMSS